MLEYCKHMVQPYILILLGAIVTFLSLVKQLPNYAIAIIAPFSTLPAILEKIEIPIADNFSSRPPIN